MAGHDNRLEDRKACFVHAFVSDIEDTRDVKCIIRDISANGCKIVSSQVHELPDLIHLTPEDFDRPLRGRIVWRKNRSAGVLLCSASENDDPYGIDALFANCTVDDDDDAAVLLLSLAEKPPTFGERLKRFIPRRRRR